MIVEGAWEIETADENGLTIKLIPESASDTPATLTVSADRATAVYTPESGGPMNLTNTASAAPEAQVTLTFAGEVPVPGMEGEMAPMTLSAYDDGTCSISLDIFGNPMEMDTGTYTMAEDGMTINFNFGLAGEIASELNYETFVASVHYVAAGTIAGDVDTILTIVTE